MNNRLERRLDEWPISGRVQNMKPKMKIMSWQSSAYGKMIINYLEFIL